MAGGQDLRVVEPGRIRVLFIRHVVGMADAAPWPCARCGRHLDPGDSLWLGYEVDTSDVPFVVPVCGDCARLFKIADDSDGEGPGGVPPKEGWDLGGDVSDSGLRSMVASALEAGFEAMGRTVVGALTRTANRPIAVVLLGPSGWQLVAVGEAARSQVWTLDDQPEVGPPPFGDQVNDALHGVVGEQPADGGLPGSDLDAVPIRVGTYLAGLLVIGGSPGPLEADPADLVARFAALLGGWLDNHRRHLHARVEQRRMVDEIVHDLRGPLQAIASASQTLQVYDTDDDTDSRLLTIITANARRMAAWLDGVLQGDTITTVGHPGEPPVEIDLAELVDDLADNTRLMLSNPDQVEVTADGHGHIKAAPNTLRRLLTNLTSNAAHHTRSGHITITAQPAGHTVVFTVADTGPGLADRGDRDYAHGFGLGLTIVHRLARRLGATIDIDTTQDVGTTITITVPTDPDETT